LFAPKGEADCVEVAPSTGTSEASVLQFDSNWTFDSRLGVLFCYFVALRVGNDGFGSTGNPASAATCHMRGVVKRGNKKERVV
jgi:hypothetical protein